MSENTKAEVEISLNGAGIVYKGKISPIMAANILKLCVLPTDQDTISMGSLNIANTGLSSGEEKLSLAEFVQKYEPSTYPQKIVAIATYQKEHKGQETFSPEDIRPLFRTIGDVPPANFGRDFRVALSNGWIAQDEQNKNNFYLTGTGRNALLANFSGSSVVKRKTRKRKKTESAIKK